MVSRRGNKKVKILIQINELRIGNVISCLNYQGVVTQIKTQRVKDVLYSTVQVDYKEYHLLEHISGIPLTPEIFIKCGFVKQFSNDSEERIIWSYQVGNNNSLYYDPALTGHAETFYISHQWNNNHYQNSFWNSPKCLHQLQNLVFYLAGEEIKINL